MAVDPEFEDLAPVRVDSERSSIPATSSAIRILQAERLRLVFIRENFRVTCPIYHRIERFLGGPVAQMILQLLLEAHPRSAMAGALIKHTLDVIGQRNGGEQVLGEHPFAALRVEIGEAARGRIQQDVTLLDLAEA